MKTWLAQHEAAVATAWSRLWYSPLNTLLALLVIGIALTLPAAGYVFLDKLSALSERAAAAQQISVFMTVDASQGDSAQIQGRLKQTAGIRGWKLISKESAWQDLQAKPGMSEVLVGLTRNPLPDAFVVDVAGMTPTQMETLKQQFAGWPKVAHVQLDSAWVQRLEALLRIGRLLVLLLAGLFAAGLVAITFNTIRLQVLAQGDEIEVSRLIGATDAFIRRPFAYAGVLQGVLGALLAVVFLTLAMLRLQGPVGELVALYGGQFALGGLKPVQILVLLLGGGLLGWLGAWLSVQLSLRQIDV